MVFLRFSDSRKDFFIKQTVAKFDNVEEVKISHPIDIFCCKEVPKQWFVHSQAFRFLENGFSCTLFKTRVLGSRYNLSYSSFGYLNRELFLTVSKGVAVL